MFTVFVSNLFRKFSIFLLLFLTVVSFIAGPFASIVSLIVLFGFGLLISSKTPNHKLLSAALLPLIPSLIMQAFYFLDRAKYYSSGVVLVMIVINIGLAVSFSFLGAIIPWYLDRKKTRKDIQREKKKISFKDNLQRITASVLLTAFLLQNIIIPLGVVKAETGTSLSSDEFILNFDPENEYSTSSETVLAPPKNRMPKDGLSTMSQEQLYEYCLNEGFAISVSECGQFTPPAPPVQMYEEGYWYSEPVIPNVVQQVYQKATGKKTTKAAKGKKLSAWDQVKGFGKGVWDTGTSFAGILIKAPLQAAQWVYKNPNKALKAAGNLAWMNPITWPVGAYKAAKWGWENRITIANTAVALKKAGDNYGWRNVAKAALFSPEAVKAWQNKEYGYALGRGMSEFALNVITFIPPVAAAKIPVVGEKIAVAVSAVHKVNEVLTGATLIGHVVSGTSMAVRGSAQLLKTSIKGEEVLAKAIKTEAFVNVIETVVTSSAKAEFIASTAKNASKGNILESVVNIEKKAAQLAAYNKALSKTSENIAKMYENGKTYSKSYEYVHSGLKNGTLTGNNATTYISAVSKNKGIQTLVNDSARPEVVQKVSELASRGQSRQVNKLNEIGIIVERKGIKPIAVKTFNDGTSEVLTLDKRGNALVYSMSADGKIISKTYTPKVREEDVFARAYAVEGGTVNVKSKSIQKAEVKMAGKNSSGNTAPFIIDHKNLPKTVEESAAVGSMIDPAHAKGAKYTPKQLSDIEKANQYAKSGAHVEERHIGKSDLELMIRAIVEGKDRISTYSNDAAYTRVVNEVLSDSSNKTKIINWLRNGSSRDVVRITFESSDGDSLGRVYDNISKTYTDSNQALVVLKKRPDAKGYYILTSYVL